LASLRVFKDSCAETNDYNKAIIITHHQQQHRFLRQDSVLIMYENMHRYPAT